MHLADAFIQSDLQCIQGICFFVSMCQVCVEIMEAIQSTRFSCFCCGVYSFLHHANLSKTEHFVLQVILLTLLSCYKLNRCYIKLSLVNILENVFVFIEIV